MVNPDDFAPFCSYCGYPKSYHPVESEIPGKDGYVCEEAQIDEE
jgi:hypothetical protein